MRGPPQIMRGWAARTGRKGQWNLWMPTVRALCSFADARISTWASLDIYYWVPNQEIIYNPERYQGLGGTDMKDKTEKKLTKEQVLRIELNACENNLAALNANIAAERKEKAFRVDVDGQFWNHLTGEQAARRIKVLADAGVLYMQVGRDK